MSSCKVDTRRSIGIGSRRGDGAFGFTYFFVRRARPRASGRASHWPRKSRSTSRDSTSRGTRTTPSDPEMTQAGAHPNVNIYMQFCGDGAPISNIEVIPAGQPNAGNLMVTTTVPHGTADRLLPTRAGGRREGDHQRELGVVRVHRAESHARWSLVGSGVNPDIDTRLRAGHGRGVRRPLCVRVHSGPERRVPEGLHAQAAAGLPRQPDRRHSALSDASVAGRLMPRQHPARPRGRRHDPDRTASSWCRTSVFNLQTLGWEPARLGTEVVPGIPPGPLPNSVTLRTAPDFSELDEPNQQGADAYEGDQGDYGITSYQINIPKELGGNLGKVRAIDIVLCAYAPCQEDVASRNTPQTVKPAPGCQALLRQPHLVRHQEGAARGALVLASGRDAVAHGHGRQPAAPSSSGLAVRRRPRFLQRGGRGRPGSACGAPVHRSQSLIPGRTCRSAPAGVGIYRVRFRDQLEAVDVPQLVPRRGRADAVRRRRVRRPTRAARRVLRGLRGGGPAGHRLRQRALRPRVNVTPDDPSPGASDRRRSRSTTRITPTIRSGRRP